MSNIGKIIHQFFGQKQPDDIHRKFFFWLKSPVKEKEKDEGLFQLWNNLAIPADSSTEKSYKQVLKRLGLTYTGRQRRSIYIRFARMVAIFLIPVFSVLSAWWYVHNQPVRSINLIEHFVPDGEIQEIELPDNSRVTINSGSTLFYQEEFIGDVREIYLSGEAEFTVSHDEKKAFIVKTKDMRIEALGTVFNVSTYSDDSQTTTTLVEGKIQVDIKPTDEGFILKPGEQIIYDRTTGLSIKKNARLDYVLAWKKGQMVFQSVSLQNILQTLERRFDIVVYLNDINITDEKLTLKFLNNETLDEILHTLQIITGMKYKTEGDKIYIY